MPRMRTVENAIEEVRSLIDESNESTVDDAKDILPSLNRAQLYAFDMLAKHYEDPLIYYVERTISNRTYEIDIPENVFEDRIQKIEYQNAGYYYECKRISYRDITYYEVPTTVPVPAYYCIYQRKIRFLPPPDGSFTIRMWVIKEPEELVLPQGRISGIDPSLKYVSVEGIGDDLTTASNELNNYVNIIDGQTGEIKQSLQIANVSSSKITFKETPDRTSVLNRTISGTPISTNISLDDYIAVVKGTCIPILIYPLYNFIIQYSVNEMNRKLKNEFVDDKEILKMFSDMVEHTWAERELTLRIKMKSKHWMPRRARRNTGRQ